MEIMRSLAGSLPWIVGAVGITHLLFHAVVGRTLVGNEEMAGFFAVNAVAGLAFLGEVAVLAGLKLVGLC